MQPGHEEVALAPELEELLIEGLLDESSFFAQEMTVRLKRNIKIMYKTLFIFPSPEMRGNKFGKSHIHILEPETLSRESRVTESA